MGDHRRLLLGDDRRDVDVSELMPLLWKARRMTDGIVDMCYRSREPVNVPDAYAFRSFGPKYRPQLDQLVGYRTKSQLCVPLLSSESGGRPLGVIQFTNKVVVQNDAADSDDDDAATRSQLTEDDRKGVSDEGEHIQVVHGASNTPSTIWVTPFSTSDVSAAQEFAKAVAKVLELNQTDSGLRPINSRGGGRGMVMGPWRRRQAGAQRRA